MIVYLLWTHGEDGPEELTGTTQLDRVVRLLHQNYPDDVKPIPEITERLVELVGKPLDVGIYPLSRGWGGLHLQVVNIETDMV